MADIREEACEDDSAGQLEGEDASCSTAALAPADAEFGQSVVKVLTTYQEHDYDVPWQMCRTKNMSQCVGQGRWFGKFADDRLRSRVFARACGPGGSGVSIMHQGRRHVLTCAHCVADQTFVQLQKASDPEKIEARVVAVCHECDLALLATEDEFLSDVPPAEVTSSTKYPALRSRVALIGFPVGGSELSITDGVVSRLEVQDMVHSDVPLLAITVDAPLNPGNSGGPAFLDGKILGIAMQGLDASDGTPGDCFCMQLHGG